MAKKAKIISANFQLRAVELHELAIRKVAPGFSIHNFTFEINIETNVDRKQKLVIASTRVQINADDKITPLGHIVCACIFSVSNFEEVVHLKDEQAATLTESFAETLNSISLSTTRGFMASELKGTILHHAFLPIIDIKSLAKEPGH